MATGASNSELAVILIDARKGVLTQTRRHAYIASLLGIRHVVLAVNKIDLVGFLAGRSSTPSSRTSRNSRRSSDFATLVPIPISARFGDNVIDASARHALVQGPVAARASGNGRCRNGARRRSRSACRCSGSTGPISISAASPARSSAAASAGRSDRRGESGRTSKVDAHRHHGRRSRRSASPGEAVTLTLADEIDVSRGDILRAPAARPEVSDQFAAHVLWMAEEELLPGRQYLLKIGTRHGSRVQSPNSSTRSTSTRSSTWPPRRCSSTKSGYGNISTSQPIAFDPYAENRDTGGFILIDRFTNATVGAGMIDFGLRRATNVHWQALDVNKTARAEAKGQKPAVLWFTGLSGSGKSTIANLVERTLFAQGRHTYLLDGDNVRHGLNRDLGFTDADRVENIRRVAEAAKLFVDAGLIVLVSFISPFRAERRMARELLAAGRVHRGLRRHADRDLHRSAIPKGSTPRRSSGEIKNFTGIDSPYEPPEAAEITLKTVGHDPAALAEQIVAYLRKAEIVP